MTERLTRAHRVREIES